MEKCIILITALCLGLLIGCKKKNTDPVKAPIICSADKMWYYFEGDTAGYTISTSGNTVTFTSENPSWENIHLAFENNKLVKRYYSNYGSTAGEQNDISSFYYDNNNKLSVYVHDNDSLIYERISGDSLKAKYYGISDFYLPVDKGYLYFKTDGNGNTLKMYSMPFYTEMTTLNFPKDTILLAQEFAYGQSISSNNPYRKILDINMGWYNYGENTKLETFHKMYTYETSGGPTISYFTTFTNNSTYQYDVDGKITDVYYDSDEGDSHARFTYSCN